MDAPEQSSRSSVPCRYCGELHPPSFSHCPKTGRALSAGRALIGQVVAGRYRVLALLGEGGMGAVYVAEHLMMGRKVALKRLHPELIGDPKAVRRFQREARAAAATGHEHIVEVIDLGLGEDGAPFLAMEYVRGKSLAAVLREEKQLAPSRACRIVGQILTALSAVHARGIVHRDLKPDNVILTHRGGDPDFVKVVDFGISKMRSDETDGGLALTRTGVTLGTPFYMSPEQARGVKELDHRVDLYGAGVMLYECLTGRLPFEGENYHQLLIAILSGKRPDVCALRPEVPAALAAIVERAIATEPDARYGSARELLSALVDHGAVDAGPPPEPPSAAPWSEPWREGQRTTPVEARRAPSDPLATTTRARATPRGLAPTPRISNGDARRFVAQSPDWIPGEGTDAWSVHEPLASYQREEPSSARPPQATPVALSSEARLETSMIAPSAAGGEPSRVKGALVSAAIEAIGAADLARVLARLDGELAAPLRRVILPMAWLPLAAYVELLRAAERELGADGSLAVRVGRATADRELTTTHRLFMQSATPQLAVERIPLLFRAYHAPGSAVVDHGMAGSTKVETEGLSPDTLVHALAMSGFYQRLLELTGARDVRASVLACRERGDEATVTALRWR